MSVIFEWFLEKNKKKIGKIGPTKIEYKSCGCYSWKHLLSKLLG